MHVKRHDAPTMSWPLTHRRKRADMHHQSYRAQTQRSTASMRHDTRLWTRRNDRAQPDVHEKSKSDLLAHGSGDR